MADYVACENTACLNNGAPYMTDDATATVSCPICEQPMVAIPPPNLDPPPPPPSPPPTPDEILEQERVLARGQIQTALARSDLWAIRQVEDGVSLTPERITYRQTLRGLLDSVSESTDPASIKIPDPPSPPS